MKHAVELRSSAHTPRGSDRFRCGLAGEDTLGVVGRPKPASWVSLLALVLLIACAGEPGRYTFSWPLDAAGARVPRGGTTTGPATTPDPEPHPNWHALQDPHQNDFERDRQAILALTGPYRVSFDFLETYSLSPDYRELDVPYQSWATEYVYLLEDRGTSISLQHVMVMFFEVDGAVMGPHVTKHWRQDWTYEDRDLHVYRGQNRWARHRLTTDQARQSWSQAVFQVDDSPRYESFGRWRHDGNYSVWESDTTWRPLPRREFSVREDYHVLVGRNRHVITPEGWIHEQENAKRVVNPNAANAAPIYLAKEIGLNRYARIRNHDFSAGDAYLERTGRYWSEVRSAWQQIYKAYDQFEVAAEVEGEKLFAVHFAAADRFAAGETPETALEDEVEQLLAKYVTEVQSSLTSETR